MPKHNTIQRFSAGGLADQLPGATLEIPIGSKVY